MRGNVEKTRIVLFGAGALSKFLTAHVKDHVEIVAYLLSESLEEIDGKPVITFNDLQNIEYDYVVVAFGNTPKGIDMLKAAGVPDEKIVGYAYSGMTYDTSLLQQQCNRLMVDMLRNEKATELFEIEKRSYYLCGMNVPETTEIIGRDYVREQTLAFLAEEIYRKKVSGNVAEIGVSAGEFAKKINYLFPDRRMYLFDTYEGLPKRDREAAIQMGWGERQYALDEKGTDPQQVVEIMPHKENCIVKKGCFPESFDLQESLAFVSLDVDFYHTVISGLKLVYPLLSKGGYLMVHDYHNLSYTETKDAVMHFCDENDVTYVPIPDVGGSIIIAK